jgi:acetyl-CoA carboxylase alpha subunit
VDTEKIFRNFGYARPRLSEGARICARRKFARPIIVFITRRQHPDQSEGAASPSIAVNLREMMVIDTPIVVIVSGEGGSGGALVAVGDAVLMKMPFTASSRPRPRAVLCATPTRRSKLGRVEARAGLLKAGIIDPHPGPSAAHAVPHRRTGRRRIDDIRRVQRWIRRCGWRNDRNSGIWESGYRFRG